MAVEYIYILLLHKIALIPPFPMSAVWWMWSETLTKRPVVGLWMVMVLGKKLFFEN
jgi:hypothetical protein